MSFKILNNFTEYELKARLFPAVFTILPLGITILIWYPQLISLESSILLSFVLIVVLFILAKLVRERGKKIQDKLFEEGKKLPTIIYLKHTENKLNKYTKARYHIYLNKNIKGLNLPTKEEEQENPNLSDEKYQSAVDWLLEKTRDTNEYPLLFQDNINYGLSRNMLGIKSLGIITSLFSLVIDFIGIYQRYQVPHSELPLNIIIISVFMSMIFLLYWIFYVKKSWVKSSSNAYARTLLSTCEDIK